MLPVSRANIRWLVLQVVQNVTLDILKQMRVVQVVNNVLLDIGQIMLSVRRHVLNVAWAHTQKIQDITIVQVVQIAMAK